MAQSLTRKDTSREARVNYLRDSFVASSNVRCQSSLSVNASSTKLQSSSMRLSMQLISKTKAMLPWTTYASSCVRQILTRVISACAYSGSGSTRTRTVSLVTMSSLRACPLYRTIRRLPDEIFRPRLLLAKTPKLDFKVSKSKAIIMCDSLLQIICLRTKSMNRYYDPLA